MSSLLLSNVSPSQAAVGRLPELADTNAVLQGVTIKVSDSSQQAAMIDFLSSFGCQELRKRINKDEVEETWMGYGPEQLSIPSDWTPGASFAKYGGHASFHIVYDPKATSALYRIGGDTPPGNNIAYVQLGVPNYRISQMVKSGGNILDAYGHVEVMSPSGLPVRGIIGSVPDPIMFIAINCVNVKESQAFYEQLGFQELDVPYGRLTNGTTLFEPAPPKKSVYMAPSPNSMGVLLLPTKFKTLTRNPVVESLNLVYAPTTTDETSSAEQDFPNLVDPSGVAINFQPEKSFEAEEKRTR
jgi:hypothetical protein